MEEQMEQQMEQQNEVYEAIITKHFSNANNILLGIYVLFRVTPESEQTDGFILAGSRLKTSHKLANQIPKHLQVGKKLKVKIINTDGHYYDLCVV